MHNYQIIRRDEVEVEMEANAFKVDEHGHLILLNDDNEVVGLYAPGWISIERLAG